MAKDRNNSPEIEKASRNGSSAKRKRKVDDEPEPVPELDVSGSEEGSKRSSRSSKRRSHGSGSEEGSKRSSRSSKRRSHGSKKRSRRDYSDSSSEDESSDSYSDSESGSSEYSSEGSESEEERRRRKRKERKKREEREKEKRRRRRREKEKKKRKGEEKSKSKKDKKKKKKDKAKKGAVTDSWGKYGIIRETDMWNKRPEFTAWLAEVKQVNLESLPNWEEKQMFKQFMEDHNTATFPSKKYYSLDAYHRRKIEKEIKRGSKKPVVDERTIFDDEEQRRLEMQHAREKQKEAEVEALKRSMQSGLAQAMKEQAQLKEEMAYQYKLGNFEAAAAIQRRLDPDIPM